MLNEITEFEQYTGNEADRLRYRHLVNLNLSGIERAMTVIARGFIYGTEEPDSERSHTGIAQNDVVEISRCTAALLRAWTGDAQSAESPIYFVYDDKTKKWKRNKESFQKKGLDEDQIITVTQPCLQMQIYFEWPKTEYMNREDVLHAIQKQYPMFCFAESCGKEEEKTILKTKGWLPQYLEDFNTPKASEIKQKLREKRVEFDFQLMNVAATDIDNDMKKITYEKIIANALNEGPLKKRYLKAKYNAEMAFFPRTKKGYSTVDLDADIDKDQIDQMKKQAEQYCIAVCQSDEKVKTYFEAVESGLNRDVKPTSTPTLAEIIPDYPAADDVDRRCLRWCGELFSDVAFKEKESGSLSKKQQTFILSLAAVILSRSSDETNTATITLIDADNWVGVDNHKDRYFPELFSFTTTKDGKSKTRPLFKKTTYDNIVRIGVCSAWIKKFGLEIVDEVDENTDDATVVWFEDKGKGCERYVSRPE